MTEEPGSYLGRFLAVAERHPARPAVIEADRTVTYAELAALARRLALALMQVRGLPGVLIHLPQTAAAFAAMFAVGLAGGFYSTTNVATPRERRRGTFAAFRPDAIITSTELASEARECCPDIPIVNVDALGPEELTADAAAHRLAYVMFTSGSTGQPKGVMISRAALGHYVDWVQDAMAVTPEDRWSQHPNIAFDLSVLDIYGALCGGAALVPIAGADLLMPARAIRRHRLTIWNSVPSVLTTMIKLKQANGRNFETLRMLTFCGEPLQRWHVESILDARRDLVVHNTYGPTEATVSCTLARLTADNYAAACQSTVAIGDAIPGMSIDLVGGDSDDEGEIVIAGPQLADGYMNDPELTARQFRSYVSGGVERRGYFTGDWARRAAGGHVFFSGRMDHQVKVRGERVELGDIATALMTIGGCFACAVLVDEDLHGIFEGEPAQSDAQAIRDAAARRLPLHLVPKYFHVAPELPRNVNGKVDLAVIRQWIEAESARPGAGMPLPAAAKLRPLT